MPVLLTAHEEGFIERLTARDGFECVHADHLAFDLAPRVSQSARRAAMAAAMRQFLKSAEGLASNSVNVANAKFFAQHAIRLYQRASETGKPISLIGLALEPRTSALEPETVNAAMSQAIKTVTRIVRAEDLVGRMTANTLVVMCAADNDCATRVSERLDGVVSGTMQRSILDRANIATSIAERIDGDSIEETLARLIRDMKSGARSSLEYS
jgi:GGDEF domain-containing protein